MNRAFFLAALLALGSSLAVTRVPGTSVIYSVNQDPITDANTSVVVVTEQYDETGDTALAVRCSSRGAPDLWTTISSRHDLMESASDFPTVIVRLGSDAPLTLATSSLYTVSDASDTRQQDRLGLDTGTTRAIVSGLLGGKRLVVRLNRASGGQPLTYTFAAAGFGAAWQAVHSCRSRTGSGTGQIGAAAAPGAPAPAFTPAPAASGAAPGGAPTFTDWSFSGCASSTQVTPGLLVGRASRCTLNVNVTPNGARPMAAEFRYELEYLENGRRTKLTLDGVDRWSAGGGGNVTAQVLPTQLSFSLPLNVRLRPERRYIAINAIGTVVFDNGSSKRVYEALPLQTP